MNENDLINVKKYLPDNTVKKYRKKPVIIEAIQFNGVNIKQILDFAKGSNRVINLTDNEISISTLEGVMKASLGDYIIKGVKGEFYPCKPDIFKQTYEEVDE